MIETGAHLDVRQLRLLFFYRLNQALKHFILNQLTIGNKNEVSFFDGS